MTISYTPQFSAQDHIKYLIQDIRDLHSHISDTKRMLFGNALNYNINKLTDHPQSSPKELIPILESTRKIILKQVNRQNLEYSIGEKLKHHIWEAIFKLKEQNDLVIRQIRVGEGLFKNGFHTPKTRIIHMS